MFFHLLTRWMEAPATWATSGQINLRGWVVGDDVSEPCHNPLLVADEPGEIIAHTVGKALDQFGIENDLFKRWK